MTSILKRCGSFHRYRGEVEERCTCLGEGVEEEDQEVIGWKKKIKRWSEGRRKVMGWMLGH